ncbi:hypothetical protein FHX35_001662 [Auritidibacter ignavus]|nr:hypothetical protein [Auritidibacter ignavus]
MPDRAQNVVLGLAIVLFSIFPEIVTWLPEVLYQE